MKSRICCLTILVTLAVHAADPHRQPSVPIPIESSGLLAALSMKTVYPESAPSRTRDGQVNLLANPSFEEGQAQWDFTNWRHNGVVAWDRDEKRRGDASIRIDNSVVDDSALAQTVPVKPQTRYQFSGWIKTRNVVASGSGASLAVHGKFEKSPSIAGDRDWSRVSFVFDTATRDSVKIGPRLGHHGRLATGTAWYDDLTLVELGPTDSFGSPDRDTGILSNNNSKDGNPNNAQHSGAAVKFIRITARVDGSGRLVFNPESLRYEHLFWSRPVNMTIDGAVWTDLSRTPAGWAETCRDLDLSHAWISSRKGRDVIALEATTRGFNLYLTDSPNGSAPYEVTIAVPRRH